MSERGSEFNQSEVEDLEMANADEVGGVNEPIRSGDDFRAGEKSPEDLKIEFQAEYERLFARYSEIEDLPEAENLKKMASIYEGDPNPYYNKKNKYSRHENALDNGLRDIESLCRHGIAISADNIIFADLSARQYGLLTKEIFPMIRLEYCKLKNLPLDQVNAPKVLFFNPPIKDPKRFTQELGGDLKGKKTVIFDESTSNGFEYAISTYLTLEPENQYNLFDDKDWDPKKSFSDERKNLWIKLRLYDRNIISDRGNPPRITKTSREINQLLPSAIVETHVDDTAMRQGGHIRFEEVGIRDNPNDPGSSFATPFRKLYPGSSERIGKNMASDRFFVKHLAKACLGRILG